MRGRHVGAVAGVAAMVAGLLASSAGASSAATASTSSAVASPTAHVMRFLTPPTLPLPICVPGVTVPIIGQICVPPALPPVGLPAPVNMSYHGGHVQLSPKIYLVLWGWGQPGAFTNKPSNGNPATDPDGAGARMQAFSSALGGTHWAGVQTQYTQTINGVTSSITNPGQQLAGVWADNTNPIHNLLTGLELAKEAERAVTHFGITDLSNADIVVAQPQNYNDAGFATNAGYCAYHDYTLPATYPGVRQGISFTNMPYVVNQGAGCGANTVNGAAGNIDGVTIVLGHELEETVTDPGAGDGWFDYSGYENGDKCAWVGDVQGLVQVPIPGALGTMTGNDGKTYPVQALWSNNAAAGLGYCAGTSELPF
jgi:hypothetical protein